MNNNVTIDLQIFPLPIIKSALYVLSERIDGRIGAMRNGSVTVSLTPIENDMDAAQAEREFHKALITASVNEHAFQTAAPIRNYLAQTAFSITSENQQTIEEFAASMGNQCAVEHDGAPSAHINISSDEFDEQTTTTTAGNRVLEEVDRIVLFIDSNRYLFPDVLWAANEMQEVCACSIDYLPGNLIAVQLQPHQSDAALGPLRQTFEHWLNIATERML